VASGWEKGVVEKNVQDSRRRIWIDANQRKFGSFPPSAQPIFLHVLLCGHRRCSA
jgi:hypothetical protein